MFNLANNNEPISLNSTGSCLGLTICQNIALSLGPSNEVGLLINSEISKGSCFGFLIANLKNK